MIFKDRDPAEAHLEYLEKALNSAGDGALRKRLERDLAIARAGVSGEREAAYHIDFHLKDSRNWAVIHDLRIEWNGRVAQMDHVILNRLLEVYVIESKSFRTKVRVANGGWERLNFNHWEGIPSPVEQNERHIVVLKEFLRDRKLAPTRLGISPRIFNVVAVQPSCSIIGDIPAGASVHRLDVLVKRLLEADVSPLDLVRAISQETLHSFARVLAECHKPAPAKACPAVEVKGSAEANAQAGRDRCHNCQGTLCEAEASYCRSRARRFAGLLLCRKCQGYCPEAVATEAIAAAGRKIEVPSARCALCADPVDRKVAAFCRFNSKRFGGRVLCRECQGKAVGSAAV